MALPSTDLRIPEMPSFNFTATIQQLMADTQHDPYPSVKALAIPSLAVGTDTFYQHLSANAALYAFALALALCCIAVKVWRKERLRLLFSECTRRGTLIIPNTTAIYLLCSTAFCVSSIAYSALLIRGFKHRRAAGFHLCLFFLWTPLLYIFWTQAFGYTALLVNSPTSNTWLRKLPAPALSCFFLSFYFIFPVLILPFVVLVTRNLFQVERTIGDIGRFCDALSAQWKIGDALEWTPALDKAFTQYFHHTNAFCTMDVTLYLVFMGCFLFTALVFIPAALSYMRILQQQLRNGPRSWVSGSTGTSTTGGMTLFVRYRLLLAETILVTLSCFGYAALACWPGVRHLEVFLNAKNSQRFYLGGLYLFAVLGLVVNLSITIRTWQPGVVQQRPSQTTSGVSSRKVHIDRDVVVLHDVGGMVKMEADDNNDGLELDDGKKGPSLSVNPTAPFSHFSPGTPDGYAL